MKTLILSDLHLGPEGATPIYAGDDALPALIRAQGNPLRVILNGDTFDLLLDDRPLVLDPAGAAERVQSCLTSATGAKLLAALGAVLDGDGEVLIRAGNHDLELALPSVQRAVRDTFASRGHRTGKLAFSDQELPLELEAGPYKVLVTHGEQDDAFNRWRFDEVVAAESSPASFKYPAGSMLVKDILNPLKREMRFLDLLKPDFQGAILTALAVNPTAARQVIDPATLSIIKTFVASALDGAPFPGIDGKGFAEPISDAKLGSDEAIEVLLLLDDGGAFASGTPGLLRRALDKLGRAALNVYARFHRRVTGRSGELFFTTDPSDSEWEEVKRLATKFGANIVVSGHTHARRRQLADGIAYVNTGTWIELLQLPAHDAPIEDWTAFLAELKADPMLERSQRVGLRGSACLIDPEAADLEHAAVLLECDGPRA